jgi:hypothetical protein
MKESIRSRREEEFFFKKGSLRILIFEEKRSGITYAFD